MLNRTQAIASVVHLLLAASLASAVDKKPEGNGYRPHPVNKTFYINGEMTRAQVDQVNTKIAKLKSVTRVTELTPTSGYVRVAFDTHVITSHMVAMAIMGSGDVEVFIKVEIPEYESHKTNVDKVFALLLEKQKVKVTPSDVGKGNFNLTYLPIKIRIDNLLANGFNYGHIGHRIHDAPPRGLNLGIRFHEAPRESSIRLELQRPLDTRLLKIEEQGIEGCNLFTGKVYIARSPSEVSALSGSLQPGDQLVLSGSDWQDARFSFSGRGSEAAPILIRPDVPGRVVFRGDSHVAFDGSHLVIMGLEFKDLSVTRNGSVIFRLGNGKSKPAEHCIVNRIKIENCNSPDSADRAKIRMWYMLVNGHSNTVANSVFSGFKNYGQMLAAQQLPSERLQQLHILNNRFVNRPYLDDQNGYEIIQIGWSGEKARSAGSLIEANVFENCDGEAEIISLKASDIVVRRNTFAGCQGVLCLRSANRVLVEDNLFDGKDRPNTGGVRVQGSGHAIIENEFRNLRKPKNYYYWPLSLMAASVENYGDNGDVQGYGRAKDILIARNHFTDNDGRIAVGIYPRPKYPLLPRNIRVKDNVFRTKAATNSAFDYVAPDVTGELRKNLYESGNEFNPQRPPTSEAETVIVAFGDSTTAPRGELVVYADLLAEKLRSPHDDSRVVNAGVGGNHTEAASKRFEHDVLKHDPDVVIIQFGINDAAVDLWKDPPATRPRVGLDKYEQNLRHFVRTLKARGSRPVLMTPNPLRWTPKLKELYGKPPYDPRDENGFNVLLIRYCDVVRRVGKEERVPVIDVFEAFEAFSRRPGQSIDDLLLDGMHPSARGQRIVADLLMELPVIHANVSIN